MGPSGRGYSGYKFSNSQPNIVYYYAFWVYKWLSNTFINISFLNKVLKISVRIWTILGSTDVLRTSIR